MASFSSHGGSARMAKFWDDAKDKPQAVYEELEVVLSQGFAETQAHVHVDTTALKFSGTKFSSETEEGWEGGVEYGGDGIDYAIYEMYRGGEHNFMYPLYAMYEEMDQIIRNML